MAVYIKILIWNAVTGLFSKNEKFLALDFYIAILKKFMINCGTYIGYII